MTLLLRRPAHAAGPPGFSLVEILLAAVVMLLSSIGGTALFNQATRHVRSIQDHLDEQFAISRDLAAILAINEHYACTSGACVAPALEALPPAPPDQDTYGPANVDARPGGTGTPSFRELCNQGLLANLLTNLPAQTQLEGTGVQRTVAVLDPVNAASGSASLPPHRYRVEWKDASGTLLRQVQLIPTVAAWCP